MDSLNKLLLSCYVLLCTSVVLVWMHQDSLESFWQQSYHRPPPWQTLNTVAAWQAGARVHSATTKGWESFLAEMSRHDQAPTPVVPLPLSPKVPAASADAAWVAILEQDQHITTVLRSLNTQAMSQDCQCSLLHTQELTATQQSVTSVAPSVAQFKPYATISSGQRVFFAGDSMMQGVAPHLAVRLRREYGLSSLDLSRQSTGLAYPKSFNWPATIAQTLADNPDIKLMAIFLGPNDPWDMPSGQGGQYLRYATADWEALYRSRIRNVIDSAQRHNVDIIWVGSPNMRRTRLSTQVNYLNDLYRSEVLQAGEVFLSSNQVFQYVDTTYSDYMGDGSVPQKMRSGDGIHFTPAGQRTIADALFELIVFMPEKQTEHEAQLATHTLN